MVGGRVVLAGWNRLISPWSPAPLEGEVGVIVGGCSVLVAQYRWGF